MGRTKVIVLDTHAWIWYIDSPAELSPKALVAINKAREKREVFISCISSWEVYMLVRRGRLRLSVEPEVWIARCEQLSFLRFQQIDNRISRLSINLPGEFHADPADRFIVATANYLGASLVTKDGKIREYKHVRTIW